MAEEHHAVHQLQPGPTVSPAAFTHEHCVFCVMRTVAQVILFRNDLVGQAGFGQHDLLSSRGSGNIEYPPGFLVCYKLGRFYPRLRQYCFAGLLGLAAAV